jgi:predicted SAM-dependent methyltransferase
MPMAMVLRQTVKRYPALLWAARRARALERFGLRWTARVRRQAMLERYLATHAVRKLQIGSLGQPLPGWLNCDIAPTDWQTVYLDATQRFPMPAGSFDAVFAEHMIEHIPYAAGLRMLRECCRILKPGGRIRIVTPRLGFLFEMLQAPSPAQLRYLRFTRDEYLPDVPADEASFVVNNMFYNYGHRFIYDERTLVGALAAAGFSGIVQARTCASDDPNFQGVDQHWKLVGREMNDVESMVFEATRPCAASPAS